MNRTRAYLAAALSSCALPACEDEGLQQLHSAIRLCPAEDPAAAPCDRGMDAGDAPLEGPLSLSVWARNDGDAPLRIREVRTEPPGLVVVDAPDEVPVGRALPLALSLQASSLGEAAAVLTVRSDDPLRPEVAFPIAFRGVAPKLQLCDVATGACAATLDVDLGVVRRSRGAGRVVLLKNEGTAPLRIDSIDAHIDESVAGELSLLGSTRPGVIEVGGSVDLLFRYEPADAVADSLTLTLSSNDPDTPEARLTVRGDSEENLPPIASAAAVDALDVVAGDAVLVDGAASSDPEGDPLSFSWTLAAPQGSAAALVDPSAPAQVLQTDVPGSYALSLVVTDSLGQASAPATIQIEARPRYGLRVTLEWQGSGDLDLHVVRPGGEPFGEGDCSFARPAVEAGDPASSLDDLILQGDAEQAPGREDVVVEVPAAGAYGVYVHAWGGADASGGAVDAAATVRVTLNEDEATAFTTSSAIADVCALWHAADMSIPEGTVVASTAVSETCP